MAVSYVRSLDTVGRDDVAIAGGNGANLGELIRAGLPVPTGFVVTTEAYRAFVDFNALTYVLSGRGHVGPLGQPLDEGQLAVLGTGDALTMRAADGQPGSAPGWDVLVLGGLPIREPVARYGPFVMNTRQEILQAMEDYQAGRLGQIPAEHLVHRTAADERLT